MVWFFLLLLAAIDLFLYSGYYGRPRIMPLFEMALVLNAMALGWFLASAFRPPEGRALPRPFMTAIVLALILMLNSIVFMGAYFRLQMKQAPVAAMAGGAPVVQWEAFDGTKHTLREFSGHAAVLHFWATWCVPCRRELPQLLAFAKTHPDITFLLFDTGDKREKADPFLARTNAESGTKDLPNILYAWDPDSALAFDNFKVTAFPSSLVMDAKGQMLRRYTMAVDWGSKDVGEYLESLH